MQRENKNLLSLQFIPGIIFSKSIRKLYYNTVPNNNANPNLFIKNKRLGEHYSAKL